MNQSEIIKILLTTLLFILLPSPTAAQIVVAPGDCPPGYELVPPDQCVAITPPPLSPEPVIIIPGILVSYNPDITLLDKETGGSWGFAPTSYSIYRGLIERLEQAGLDVDVFVAHYDWRKPAAENAAYLKTVISQAKQATSSDNVDIVAHSFGGIVAREYIQGPQYDQDVNQLITMGTPHKGSADAYVAREGGIIPDRWSVGARWYITLVERTLNATALAAPLPRPLSLRTFFPSLQDLLPTDPFVTQTSEQLPLGNMADRNLYLENRNATLEQDLAAAGVELTTLAGTGLNTLETVPVTEGSLLTQALDAALSRWRDGHPTPSPPETDTTDGDQTVTLASAKLDDTDPVTNITHDKLPEELQEEVLEALGVDVAGSHIAYDLPDRVLGTAVLSPVIATVNFPDGTSFTCNQVQEQDQATCLVDSADPDSPKLLVITDPPEGDYTITYTGTGEGEYTIITSYADEDETVSSAQSGTTEPGAVMTDTIAISHGTTSLIDDEDYKTLLQEILTLARQAKHNGTITSSEFADITQHGRRAQADLRLYERFAGHDRSLLASFWLKRYYDNITKIAEQAERIAGELPIPDRHRFGRRLFHRDERNHDDQARQDFADELTQIVEKITAYSPPLPEQ
jgi:pimeloyl-ACP methyl ester carboxylesterase